MPVKGEGERAILILLGIHILSKIGDLLQQSGQVLQQGGAQLYDALHDDEGHKQDLPAAVGVRMPTEAVLALATLAGFPDPKLATAIAIAESGGLTKIENKSPREHSVGLWQINTRVHPYTVADMGDPMKNALAAFQISKGGTDWTPWGAFTHPPGSPRYLQFRKGILAP
jgi:hypothetical protein